jgi:hypothetical protein
VGDMRAARARVTVDFELDSEPIEGSLLDCDRSTRTFSGSGHIWRALLAVLAAALLMAASAPSARANATPGLVLTGNSPTCRHFPQWAVPGSNRGPPACKA